MSIISEIARIQTAKEKMKAAILSKYIALPSSAKLSNYHTYISQITGSAIQYRSVFTRTVVTFLDPELSIIGAYAFYNCSSLINVNTPNCTRIENEAFGQCTSLTSISAPLVTYIGGYAFTGCSHLTDISMPKVTTISSYAFLGCDLEKVSFPNCTTIGEMTFRNNKNLSIASFPNCTTISYCGFYECSRLITAKFSKCTKVSSGAFERCSSLAVADFERCTTVEREGFSECSLLNTVNFPSLVSIYSSAFYKCSSLTVVSLPKCTLISDYAFNGCSKLFKLYVGTSNCNLYTSRALGGTLLSTTGYIYVPTAYVATYKAKTNWTYFSSRIYDIANAPVPTSLSVSGDWTNVQYTGEAPDITGLIFTCTFANNTSGNVPITSVSPATWSNTAGSQTATFSYTENGTTVTATKVVNVQQCNKATIQLSVYLNNTSNSNLDSYVSGSGKYEIGETCHLFASSSATYSRGTKAPDPGGSSSTATFSRWASSDGTTLSTSNSYSFTVTEDVTIIAHYIS